MAKRPHPFPFRTRKLSSSAPMVVGTHVPVRVGRRQATRYGGLAQLGEHLPYKQRVGGSIPSSSTIYEPLAQSVEHLTFNQRVEGSSPSWLTLYY